MTGNEHAVEDVVSEALWYAVEWGTDVGASPEKIAQIAVIALREAGLLINE